MCLSCNTNLSFFLLSAMYPAYHPMVAGIEISRRDWMNGLVLCYMNRLDENIRLFSGLY